MSKINREYSTGMAHQKKTLRFPDAGSLHVEVDGVEHNYLTDARAQRMDHKAALEASIRRLEIFGLKSETWLPEMKRVVNGALVFPSGDAERMTWRPCVVRQLNDQFEAWDALDVDYAEAENCQLYRDALAVEEWAEAMKEAMELAETVMAALLEANPKGDQDYWDHVNRRGDEVMRKTVQSGMIFASMGRFQGQANLVEEWDHAAQVGKPITKGGPGRTRNAMETRQESADLLRKAVMKFAKRMKGEFPLKKNGKVNISQMAVELKDKFDSHSDRIKSNKAPTIAKYLRETKSKWYVR